MLHLRRTRLILRRRGLPWLLIRPHLANLRVREVNVLLAAEPLRLPCRVLAPYDEVLLLRLPGRRQLKACLPFSLLVFAARRSPRRLLNLDNHGSYRYIRLDGELLLAVASEQMVLVSSAVMSLKHALDLAASHLAPEKPQPHAV
jgi:hypothetical protein